MPNALFVDGKLAGRIIAPSYAPPCIHTGPRKGVTKEHYLRGQCSRDKRLYLYYIDEDFKK